MMIISIATDTNITMMSTMTIKLLKAVRKPGHRNIYGALQKCNSFLLQFPLSSRFKSKIISIQICSNRENIWQDLEMATNQQLRPECSKSQQRSVSNLKICRNLKEVMIWMRTSWVETRWVDDDPLNKQHQWLWRCFDVNWQLFNLSNLMHDLNGGSIHMKTFPMQRVSFSKHFVGTCVK